jgi:xanthine/CO dehydrogenase XdhC/CoxF family maturation factor
MSLGYPRVPLPVGKTVILTGEWPNRGMVRRGEWPNRGMVRRLVLQTPHGRTIGLCCGGNSIVFFEVNGRSCRVI